jgi:hypothetical protein
VKARLANGVTLEVPDSVASSERVGVDSPTASYEGDDLSVVVDQGPFVDRLESNASGTRLWRNLEEIDGTVAVVVATRDADPNWTTYAAHFPEPVPLTIVVRARKDLGPEIPLSVIRSVRRPESRSESR